jgi:hypothetical protein
MSIVEEFINQKIYKIKHIHSSAPEDYDVYIFVGGYYDNDINKLLEKIEKNDYKSLTDEENKKLSHVIPNFRAKFGKIKIGNTYFVKDLIFDNDSINIIRMKISHHINRIKKTTTENHNHIGVHHQHLWIKSHNITYKDMIKFINSLLNKNTEISLNDMVNKLCVVLDLESIEDIEKMVRTIFSEKYKNKSVESGINLFKNSTFTSDYLINDEEFIALLNHRHVILGREYKKKISVTSNEYIDTQLYVVANPFSSIVNLSDKIIMDQESDKYSKVLNEFGLVDNNIINLVTHMDFIYNYKGISMNDVVNMYWDSNVSNYTTQSIKNEKEAIDNMIEKLQESNNKLIQLLFDKKHDDKKYKSLVDLDDDYLVNDLIIGINDVNYQSSFDIDKLFNVFETSNRIPFVKFVINDYNNNYKIYKPFLKKHNFKLKVIASWKNNQLIQDIEYPSNKKYIVFKLLLNEKSDKTIEDYVSISLYENGYTIINFNMKKYVSIKTIKESLEEITEFINKLMKITDSKLIHQPESNMIFRNTYHNTLIRTQILSITLKTQVIMKDKSKFALSIDELNNRVQSMYPFFYGNMKNNNIKVIYKKVNDFDSTLSIQNFINKIFEKNKRGFDGQKSTYIELLESIFLIDKTKAKQIIDGFNPQDIPENIKYHFLYGTDISISVENDKYSIMIENLHQLKHLNAIHSLLHILFNPDFDIEKTEQKKTIEIDFEEKSSLMVSEPVVDLGFDFDELGFDDLGLDVNLEAEFQKGEEEKAKEVEKAKEAEKIVVDYDIKKKGNDMHEIKFTNYMTKMRETADPGLYKVEDVGNLEKDGDGGSGWKYSRTCDATQMRQPYIIPKENLDKIKDKSAITGYVKYRDQYYICPRIWDYKAEMPISVDEFVKSGLKSPYNKGDVLPYDKRNKEFLGDKYTVIVRRPTSEAYWSKENVEKKWPEILKNTGAEAFPGFMKPKNHPKNLCVPCCFLKEPDDYDVNAKEIQAFKKPVGHDVCDVQTESEVQKSTVETKEFRDEALCKNENYIKADIAVLDNCRYGQLPENLNILLRNHQELLISSTSNALFKYANCFLRRGVYSDKNSFLRSIAAIKETISSGQITYKTLINTIVENIRPELFMTLNQGSLINVFKFNNNLPKNRTQLYYFGEFVKKYPELVAWLGMKDFKIDSFDDLIKLQNNQIKLRKVKKLFTVFSSFYNFTKYCQDDKIVKKHEFFLDLISRKLDWLFPEGANVMMFSKETNNIFCNPYINDIKKPVIMLLYDSNGKFEPIFNVQYKSVIETKGIIKLNSEVNMSTKNMIFLKNHLKNQTINLNLLKNTQNRLPVLRELVKIHLNNCNELPNKEVGNYKLLPTSNAMYNKLMELSESDEGLVPVAQITTPLHTTEFIITENKNVFPVRPSSIILELPVYDGLEYFDLIDLKHSENLMVGLEKFNKKLSGNDSNLYYKTYGLVVTEMNPETVIGILLDNDGLIPIYPTSIEKMLETGDKLGLKLNIIVKNIYYEVDYKIYDNQKLYDDRVGYLEEYTKFENLYQHFKYEISSILGENKNASTTNKINDILNVDSIDYNVMIGQIKPIIEKLVKKISYVDKNETKTKKNPNYKLTTCHKLSQKKCNNHMFCKYNPRNGCGVNLETNFWSELFINRLCETIARNPREREQLLNGEFKPLFYLEEGLKVSDNEIFLTNENFYLIKQIYKSSRYHQEIDNFETVESETVHDRVIKVKYHDFNKDEKSESSETEKSSDMEGDTSHLELTGLSGMKKKLKNVYATVFDKDGKYRSQYQAGPCIFPYVYGNTKQLLFDCNADKEEGLRCPVQVDKNRRALKWGFCPSDPKEVRKAHNVEEIQGKATNLKGKIDKGFKSGKCIFPFRYHPSYDLSWECISTTQGNKQKWCATSMKTGKNVAHDLPIAAKKEDKIYQKKWDWASMYDEKGNFNDDFLRYQTRGYCPAKEIKKNVEEELTIENFNMAKCNQTDSKGGYSKNILKKFATKYLGFNEKDIEGKKKELICQMIGERLSNMKTTVNMEGKTLLDIYHKDPKLCNKGESGGGYYLGSLRKLASRYFGMDPEVSNEASKKELCDFIVPILDKESEKLKHMKTTDNINLFEVYNKNPNYCEEGPRKGGYTLKELKEMGVKYFGVSDDINDKKEICDIIRNKLNDEKFKMMTTGQDEHENMYSDVDDEEFSFLTNLKSVKGKHSIRKKRYYFKDESSKKLTKKKGN